MTDGQPTPTRPRIREGQGDRRQPHGCHQRPGMRRQPRASPIPSESVAAREATAEPLARGSPSWGTSGPHLPALGIWADQDLPCLCLDAAGRAEPARLHDGERPLSRPYMVTTGLASCLRALLRPFARAGFVGSPDRDPAGQARSTRSLTASGADAIVVERRNAGPNRSAPASRSAPRLLVRYTLPRRALPSPTALHGRCRTANCSS